MTKPYLNSPTWHYMINMLNLELFLSDQYIPEWLRAFVRATRVSVGALLKSLNLLLNMDICHSASRHGT
jgi:hypothetical protein